MEINNRLEIDIYPSNFCYVNYQPNYYHSSYGTHSKVQIQFDQSVIDAIEWVKQYKKQLDHEAKLRMENPALMEQFLSYQTLLKMVDPNTGNP